MKKAVKSLIIAASVAAIAGIGAVSFAAWSGGSATETVNGSSGTITAVGFVSCSVTNGEGDALMPYNQPSLSDNQAYYYAVKLTLPKDTTATKIHAAVAGRTAETGTSGVPTGLKYSTTATPSGGSGASLSEDNWNPLGSGADVATVSSGTTEYTIYIALDSDDTTYNTNAGLNFTITFTLVTA